MKRVITATIFLIISLFVVIAGGPVFALFIAGLCFLGLKELDVLLQAKGFKFNLNLVYVVGAIVFTLALLNKPNLIMATASLATIATFLAIMARNTEATIADTAVTVLGFMYGTFLPAHLILIRNIDTNELDFFNFDFNVFNLSFNDGFWFIFILFFVITVCDIAGFYVGTNLGKHPLCPYISPKKTVEGAIGSTVLGILASICLGFVLGIDILNSFLIGALIVASAQLGDLAESMIKRDANIKDSSDILPGHGGILDRADSYMFTGAIVYYYLHYAYPIVNDIAVNLNLA